jgi:hypothetical protein
MPHPLLLGLLLAPYANADEGVQAIEVQVNEQMASGWAWDVFGGAPDILICTSVGAEQTCAPYACSDAFRCSAPLQLPPQTPFTVQVVDQDLAWDDPIGEADCDEQGRCVARGQLASARGVAPASSPSAPPPPPSSSSASALHLLGQAVQVGVAGGALG